MKLLASLCLAVALGVVSAPSFAFVGGGMHFEKSASNEGVLKKLKSNKSKCGKFICKSKKSKRSVPEIDAANAGIALALLGGVVAIAGERRKRIMEA